MSMAEFYIDNGIDPCDPHGLDDFLYHSGVFDDAPAAGVAAQPEQYADLKEARKADRLMDVGSDQWDAKKGGWSSALCTQGGVRGFEFEGVFVPYTKYSHFGTDKEHAFYERTKYQRKHKQGKKNSTGGKGGRSGGAAGAAEPPRVGPRRVCSTIKAGRKVWRASGGVTDRPGAPSTGGPTRRRRPCASTVATEVAAIAGRRSTR